MAENKNGRPEADEGRADAGYRRRHPVPTPLPADDFVWPQPRFQERAARSGAGRHAEQPGMAPPGQGGQVILTSDAMDAARGGLAGEIADNVIARNHAIVEGHVVDGTTAAAAAGAIGLSADDVVKIYGEMPDEPPPTVLGSSR